MKPLQSTNSIVLSTKIWQKLAPVGHALHIYTITESVLAHPLQGDNGSNRYDDVSSYSITLIDFYWVLMPWTAQSNAKKKAMDMCWEVQLDLAPDHKLSYTVPLATERGAKARNLCTMGSLEVTYKTFSEGFGHILKVYTILHEVREHT